MDNLQYTTPSPAVRVVLFSGGSGSGVLSKELIRDPQVSLTLAINGYDDGASTGEVRRFLGDSLGPSDFRKNASRLARELQSCSNALIDLLDLRLPMGYSEAEAREVLHLIYGKSTPEPSGFHARLGPLLQGMEATSRKAVANSLSAFEEEFEKHGRAFVWSDCSIGNLSFAGCFLRAEKNFNRAVEEYCTLLHLPAEELIENVTTGANAWLVAVDSKDHLIGSEAEIVDASNHKSLKDIYLVDHFLTEAERHALTGRSLDAIVGFLQQHRPEVEPNPRLLRKISAADLIVYAPGTQHSSLFPSYMTPGIGTAIAQNLKAIKLLITNIQKDAEISESSAVDIIDKALYYLREKGRLSIPTPCLITHYMINDPNSSDASTSESEAAYVPLGRLENIEDPRLVRIGNYEERLTGRHQAEKVLTPFITSILKGQARPRVAVFLRSTVSPNKISQSILEMLRGGIQDLSFHLEVFYYSQDSIDQNFTQSLPFEVNNIAETGESAGDFIVSTAQSQSFDYVILFNSSGMYKGEDIVNLAALLTNRRLDAIWGSRRLSIKDIRESYKMRYQHNTIVGSISYIGSHILSLAYLLLYGRYITDSLSNIQAVRSAYLGSGDIDFGDPCVNHQILSVLLRSQAEVFESPVQFFPITPEKVRRTRIVDGVRALGVILKWRFRSLKRICLASSW